MFHRKQSAGTRQKDKFRHRKAIRRIVSRPRNLKFPGGHDAFTNYFYNIVLLYFLLKSFNLLNINNMHNFLYINLFINLIPPTDF